MRGDGPCTSTIEKKQLKHILVAMQLVECGTIMMPTECSDLRCIWQHHAMIVSIYTTLIFNTVGLWEWWKVIHACKPVLPLICPVAELDNRSASNRISISCPICTVFR